MNRHGLSLYLLLGICIVGAIVFVNMFDSSHAIGPNDCTVPSLDYETIQSAVNDTNCDTINLTTMTYVENVTIDRTIKINGEGAINSIIDGDESDRVFNIGTNGAVTMTAITIENGSSGLGAGIYNLGTLSLLESVVKDNTVFIDGGGLFNGPSAKMIVENSAIINNRSTDFSGGGIRNEGMMYLNNVTISQNQSRWSGGGVSNEDEGILLISNATITNNTGVGGGIAGNEHGSGYIEIQNSLVSGNFNSYSGAAQDCARQIISRGYNLIGTVENCSFQASNGDLLNIQPSIDSMTGSPPYIPLLIGPGIDSGNPEGCRDHMDELLLTDQRGEPRHRRCDIGAYEYDGEFHITFLPMCMNNYCAPFYDDFNNPNSGWYVGDNNFVRSEYLNGEYRILTKQSGYVYVFSAPSCAREYYASAVDVRWAENRGAEYGLLMGINSNFDEYYMFLVSADYQDYGLIKHTPGGWQTIVAFTPNGNIHAGNNSNHLEAVYVDGNMTLSVNGTLLGTWFVGYANAPTWTGIVAHPYDDVATADARFDNFSVETRSSLLQFNEPTVLGENNNQNGVPTRQTTDEWPGR